MMDKPYHHAMIWAEGNVCLFAGEFFTSPLLLIILTTSQNALLKASARACPMRLRLRLANDAIAL